MGNVIDVHVHFGAPGKKNGDPDHGCYWSERFEHSIAFWAFRFVTGTVFGRMSYARAEKKVNKLVRKAKQVDQIVLLALDQVYDRQGNLRADLTNLSVENKTIVGLAARNPKILLGCSVHPYRGDWEAELDYCLANKAVLCKWLPSAQCIDPSDPKCGPFYQKLADHQLPLLCHVGLEKSIPASDDHYKQFNNANYLRPALQTGVPVIFAHGSLPFEPTDLAHDADFQNFLRVMDDARTYHWKAYADLSALLLLRASYIDDLRAGVGDDRLILGSDWPIPMISLGPRDMPTICDRINHFFDALCTENLLDKNYKLLEDFGIPHAPDVPNPPPDAYTRAADLFSRILY